MQFQIGNVFPQNTKPNLVKMQALYFFPVVEMVEV